MAHQHLYLSRDEPVTDRHRPQRGLQPYKPTDPKGFGTELKQNFDKMLKDAEALNIGGFDNRRLIKITLRKGEMLPPLEAIPGVEIVSQEDREIILAFADSQGVSEFEARLTTLAKDGKVTREQLFFAIQDFDHWRPEDRLGPALKVEGTSNLEKFILDVELWPLEGVDHRKQMLQKFEAWLIENGIEILDRLNQPSLILIKVRLGKVQAEKLLSYRDVRIVDLPPRQGLSAELLLTDMQTLPTPSALDSRAGAITILDSGLSANHPALQGVVGEAAGFLAPNRDAGDNQNSGHGTFVSGLAVYGDLESRIRSGNFVPNLRLFSGKVFNDDDADQTSFVEKAVDEAVKYFNSQYGCKVFNLSYGDQRKVYDGRHIRGLAYTLDRLTRELGILFIVPTGNLENIPRSRAEYPQCLLSEIATIIDPATALNAITVGGLATKTATMETQAREESIEDIPIAASLEPSPFTRRGPTVGNAIKPDLVEDAGNLAGQRQLNGPPRHRGLGLISLNAGFATGRPFRENIGTSFAAPIVAHKAAKLQALFPDQSVNFLRSLLALHARWPQPAIDLLTTTDKAETKERLLNILGYGKIDDVALYSSLDQVVTLYSEEAIENNKHHFYELPIPDEFWDGRRQLREVSVSLAYSPEVRTTRIDYKNTQLWFSFVTGKSLSQVTRAFTNGRDERLSERASNRSVGLEDRKSGTLQMSTWTFPGAIRDGNKLFVVVTRKDANWSTVSDEQEPYSLSVLLRDAENTAVNLYAKVNALLQLRAQERGRARL